MNGERRILEPSDKCISFLGLQSGFKQHILPQFWRLETQSQGEGRAMLSEGEGRAVPCRSLASGCGQPPLAFLDLEIQHLLSVPPSPHRFSLGLSVSESLLSLPRQHHVGSRVRPTPVSSHCKLTDFTYDNLISE